jgi:hypothetical protein
MAKKLPASKRKVKVSVALSPELIKRVDRMAKALGQSRSQVIEDLIDAGIQDSEITAAAMTNPVIVQALMGAFGRPDVIRQMASSMKQDLTEDQLHLFQNAMVGMTAAVTAQQQPKRIEKKQ